MKRPTLLVSTCGTSLLTNGASDDARRAFTAEANGVVLTPPTQTLVDARVAMRREELAKVDLGKARRLSAEINGIAAVYSSREIPHVAHVLIHTDTAIGTSSAELVASWLSGYSSPESVLLLSAGGLRTDQLASFREAVADLTVQLEGVIHGYRARGYEVLFNLTGGFKSLNGYLQALGMLWADACVYLFESSAELVRIPRLPIDLSPLGAIRPHRELLRRMALGYPVTEDEVSEIPDALLLVDAGAVTTSVWGDVVWARSRRELYGEELLPSLSPKLTWSHKFARAFEGLEGKRKAEVNMTLDALAAWLDGVRKVLPSSHKLKPLQGKPVPGSTHEVYAWSDGEAGRLLAHYEGASFVIDDIAPHL